jgi:hypothetical protein
VPIVEEPQPEPLAKLNVTPSFLNFSYRELGPLPPPQFLTVTVNGNHTVLVSADASAPGSQWASVSGGGLTPTQLKVTVSPTLLVPGVYNATIVVHGTDELNRKTQDVLVPVTLTVTQDASLTAVPSQLTFQHQFGGALPSAQQIKVDSTTGVSIPYSVSTDEPWLRASGGGATPGNVTVTLTELPIGTYQGNVVVTSAQAANSPLLVEVRFVVTPAPVLASVPSSVTFQHRQGTPAPAQVTLGISVIGSQAPLHVTPSTSAAAPWLNSTGGGATPTAVFTSVNPTGLTPGTYTNAITVTASEPGIAPLQVPVTLTELAAPSLSASPQQLSFVKVRGSANPPTQTVSLSVNPPQTISFSTNATTSSGGNWLSVLPSNGLAPGTLTVSVQPGSLGVGVYQGTVAVTSTLAANSPLQIPVMFTVEDAPAVQANPQSLSFAYQALSPSVPPDQQLTVTTSNGLPTSVAATASTSSGGPWLSVQPTGAAPGTLQVSVNPSGLAAGSYSGTITITASGLQPDTVPVTLTVTVAPVLDVLPASLTFAYQEGGAAPIPQTVSVNSSPPGIPFSVSASDPWIHAVGGGSTNSTISVSVDPTGLAAGSDRGFVTVTSSQAGNSPVVVQVDLSITAAVVVSASPASLHFNYTQLGAVPAPQPVSISASKPIAFTVSVSPSTPWLSATGGGATPAIVTVTADPTGLAPGNYQGQVLVDAPGAANTPLTIPVTVTVSAAPLIQANPTQLTFSYQLGGPAPPSQALTITSGGVPVPVSATTSGEPWLSVAGSPGQTPAVFTVTTNGSSLAAGTYNATVMVSSSGATNTITVPVTLIVTAAPTLIAAPAQLSFSYQIGVANPPNQQVTVTSSSGSLTFTARTSTTTGGSWLSATGGGSTPSTVNVAINATGLAAGTYSGKVTLTASGAGNSPLDIPVTLVVADAVVLSASPPNLSFSYQQGGSAPPSQQIQVTSSGAQILFSASIAPGASWLNVSGDSATPGTLTVAVNPTGLAAGDYAGIVVIQSPAAANNPLEVPVSLHVAPTGVLNVTPNILRFTYVSPGSPPAAQTLNVTSTGSPLDFQATVSPGAAWLHVSGGGTTPGTLQVSVDPTGLAVGQYNGTILVSSTTVDSFELVAVTLTVSTLPNLSTSPTSMSFVYQIGGATPGTQMLSVTSDSGSPSVTASASTVSGGPWLSAVGSGNTPFEVVVSVNPTGLTAGPYSGTVTLTSSGAGNSPYSVPVTLIVSAAPVMTATPTSLSFAHTLGDPVLPPSQQVNISADSPVPVSVAASTSDGLAWLSVSYAGSSTPLNVTVTVNPAGLATGTHTGTITVTSSTAGNSPLTIPVSFVVSPQPALSAVPSSANFVYTEGGAVPAPFPIVIDSTIPVTVQTSVSPVVSWLTVSGGGTTTPATLHLAVSPMGLAPGVYTTAVQVTAPNAANNPLSIPVELTVLAAPLLQVKPTQLAFGYQLGGPTIPSQALTVTSGGVPVTVSAATSGESWLSVAGVSGLTPTVFTVRADGSSLAPGTYNATVTVTSSGASNSPVTVPITLIVSAGPTLQASPAQVNFSHQIGQANPPNKQVTVTSSSGSLTFSVTASTDSGGSWLTATGGGSTPSSVDIAVSPTSLTAGTYTGKVTLTSAAAGNSPLNIPVTLVVSQAITLRASPPSLSFTYQGGNAPASQQIHVTSSGAQVSFLASIAPGASWLNVSGDSFTPGNLTVAVNPTGLAPGDYAGTVVIQSSAAANNPLGVPISLHVAATGALSVTPMILRFSYLTQGSPPAPQNLTVTSTGTPLQFQATISPGATWLHVSGGGTTPGTLQVSVDPTRLAVGNYAGTLLVSSTTLESFETVLVTFSVSSLPNLSTSPASLSFEYQIQGTPPPGQTLLVTSDTGNPFVTVSSSTFSGGPWLSATGSGNTPFQVAVSVNPAGLDPGVYSGQVILSSSGANNSPYSVPVTFTVSAAPVLSANPNSLTFAYTIGDAAPPSSQQLKITSDSLISAAAIPSTANGVPWLSAVQLGNVTPLNVTASVDPTGLSRGTHTGTISVNSPVAGNSPLLIPVTFAISAQPVLHAVPASASFVYTPGGPLPQPFAILIESSSKVVVQATVSPANSWLTVSGGGSTPATLQLTTNPVGLAPGIYPSSVLVTSPGAANSPLSIPVSLQVANVAALLTTPSSLFLSADVQASAAAALQVQSTGAPLTFTASASPNTPWLAVSGAGTTPANITVHASAAGLTPGTYSGAVVITAAGAVNSPLLVPVTFAVSGAPLLTVSPATISFSSTGSGGTQSQTVTVLLNGQPAANSKPLQLRPSPWMSIQPGAGGSFVVTVDPSTVEPGDYLAGVAVTEPTASNSPILVPVRLGVIGVSVQLSANSVALAAAAGTNSATTDIIHITGGPADFSVDVTGSTWLKVSPTTGTIPVDLIFTADPTGLTPGSYPGAVTIHTKGAADNTIAVVLGVGNSTAPVVSPQTLAFRYSQGGPAPAAQSVAVSSVAAGTGLQIAGADSWLSVDTSFVTTPARFGVSVNTSGLAPGQYHSQITLTKPGTITPAVSIPVDLDVAQISSPRISTINNGASFFFPAALAPGLIFSIFGAGLGPSTPVTPAISGGLLPTLAAGVQVFVNGVPCPLLYLSDSQINAVASFAVDGNTNATVVVQHLGVSSDPVPLTATAAAPGIFSQNQAGAGAGAILNFDNSVNSPSNPATRGSFVAMFATGGGQIMPPGLDGSIYTEAGSNPQLPVSVQVGGIDAEVSYAGAAPGFVQGALQVNFRIPANVPAGENFVVLKIGNAVSQPGLTVSVQ